MFFYLLSPRLRFSCGYGKNLGLYVLYTLLFVGVERKFSRYPFLIRVSFGLSV